VAANSNCQAEAVGAASGGLLVALHGMTSYNFEPPLHGFGPTPTLPMQTHPVGWQ